MKQISTITAIFMAINEFGDNSFSIHDITKFIRKNVADGNYELRWYLDKVEHNTVKEYFLELIEFDLLNDYNIRNNPNGFREFYKNVPNVLPNAITPVTQPVVTPTTIVQNAINSTVIPTDVQLKIYKYLKNNGNVTTKMIQSRLKGHPYTCKDIYEFLNNIQLIDTTSDTLPVSQRFTVAI